MAHELQSKLLIIGSGPAGYSAAIYAARANLSPILVQGMQPGGQLTITNEVENFPGFAEIITGPFLMEQMFAQAQKVGTNIINDHIKQVELHKPPFICYGESGNKYVSEAIIICVGAQAKWLGLESEAKYQGFGVSGCATCDGFFYKGKEVLVIGGGNSAVEEALYLTNHAKKVTLVHRRDKLRAEQVLQDRLFKHPKIDIIWHHVVEEILGVSNPLGVTGARLRNVLTEQTIDVPTDGVFIAIGHSPNTSLFKGQLDMDAEGYIKLLPNTTQTSIAGVFAAGDVHDKIYRQAITAAGFGCMAALDVVKYFTNLEL